MKRSILLTAMAVLASNAIPAQQVTEFRQPGDSIRFEIKFVGPDAAKIKTVSLYLSAKANPPSDQVGFKNSFSSDADVGPSSPNTFIAEARIPNDVATGDYVLFVNARADTGATQYAAGNQFQMPAFHIRNRRTFVPPTITVTEKR